MIIIGYQGIGKSTLSRKFNKFIDLESSCFWTDGKRSDDWYIYYCQIATHLSKQGYVVFTSSHKPVRQWFIDHRPFDIVFTCAPSLELKDEWVKKLHLRYLASESEKDYKAYMNASVEYASNTQDIIKDGELLDGAIVIDSIEYSLLELISKAEENFNGKVRV